MESICAAADEPAAALCRRIGAELDLDLAVVEGPAGATRAELSTWRSRAAPASWSRCSPSRSARQPAVARAAGDDRLDPGRRSGRLADGLEPRPDRAGRGRDQPGTAARHRPRPAARLRSPGIRSARPRPVCATTRAAGGALVVSRSAVERLGGLAAQGFDQLAEVDLCLRAREAGMRIAVTRWRGSARGQPAPRSPRPRLEELFRFQRRWWSRGIDPYYHPDLAPRARRCPEHLAAPLAGARLAAADRSATASRHRSGRAGGPGGAGAAVPARRRARDRRAALAAASARLGDRVRYVDRMPVTLLRRHYPELASCPWSRSTSSTTASASNRSQPEPGLRDRQPPARAHRRSRSGRSANWLRVLRPGGAIFLAVPDKRFTFDFEREVTSLEHMSAITSEGPEVSRRQHFEEWARHVEGVAEGGSRIAPTPSRRADYSVHTHVFTERELLELLLYCDERVGAARDLGAAAQRPRDARRPAQAGPRTAPGDRARPRSGGAPGSAVPD